MLRAWKADDKAVQAPAVPECAPELTGAANGSSIDRRCRACRAGAESERGRYDTCDADDDEADEAIEALLCDACSGCDGGYGEPNRYGMPPRGVSAAAGASDDADAEEVDAVTLSETISSVVALTRGDRWLASERADRLAADTGIGDADSMRPSGWWCSGHAAASMLALSAGMRKYDTQIICISRI